jgi:hypothetical protein
MIHLQIHQRYVIHEIHVTTMLNTNFSRMPPVGWGLEFEARTETTKRKLKQRVDIVSKMSSQERKPGVSPLIISNPDTPRRPIIVPTIPIPAANPRAIAVGRVSK